MNESRAEVNVTLYYVGSEVLKAVIKTTTSLEVTSYGLLSVSRHFGRTYFFHFILGRGSQYVPPKYRQKNYQTTRRHNTEYNNQKLNELRTAP
jgi:hypothetical protein